MKTPVHSTRRRVLRGAGTLAKYLALAITAFVILMPILWFLTSSFRSNNEVFANINPFSFGKMFFGGYSLENYQTLFTKHQFAEPVLNTLLISFLTIVIGIVICSMAGYAMAKME